MGGSFPSGPTGKYFERFGLTVSGVAKQLEVERPSISKFFRAEAGDRYLGTAKQAKLRKILKRSPQQFGRDLNKVRAEHAAQTSPRA